MPRTTATKSPITSSSTSEPLKLYDGQGQIAALSYDHGKTWSPAKVEPKPDPGPTYTRKVIAVHSGAVAFQRRIEGQFAELHRKEILAGWAPLPEIEALPKRSVSAIVIPFGTVPAAAFPVLRNAAEKLFLDVDAPIDFTPELIAQLDEQIGLVDAVFVASDILAQGMRRDHPDTFTIPHVVQPALWSGFARTPSPKLRIAVQPSASDALKLALQGVQERFLDKIELVADDWLNRAPRDEPAFYSQVDIVVAGPPLWPQQVTPVNLLGALSASCAVVAHQSQVRYLKDRASGLIVARDLTGDWRKALVTIIDDSSLRRHLQRGAKAQAKKHEAYTKLFQLSLPYLALTKERKPFTVG